MLTIGGLLTSAALLTLAWFAIFFRKPDAPGWTTRAWVHEVVVTGVCVLLAVGGGYLVAGGMGAYQEGPQPIDLVLLAGVLVGAGVLWRRLDVRAQLRAFDAAAEMQERARAAVRASSAPPAQPKMVAPIDPPPSTPKAA